MGNENNLKLLLTKEKVNEIINEDKKNLLYNYYTQFILNEPYLSKNNFSKLTKIYDETIVDELFRLFSTKKDKMSFNGLKKFYASFKKSKIKYVLLPIILFGKQTKILKFDYINKLIPYMEEDESLNILIEKKFLESIEKNEKSNPTELYIDKKLFIEKASTLIKKEFSDFELVKEVLPSSSYINLRLFDIKPFQYVCDCLLEEKKDTDEINKDELEEMRIPFNNDIPAVKNGHLDFKSFEKIMNEYRVNQKLINLLLQYLKIYTMKDYMNFEDFKYIMSNIYEPVSNKNKKKFLFNMIYSIAKEKSKIQISQLFKILQIENKNFNPSETINLESIEDQNIETEIDIYLGYMEILGLLPFLRYNVKPVDPKLKKKIINFILNNKTVYDYLSDNFEMNSKFYPINMDFWKSIIDSEKIPQDQVNNSIIAEEDPIFNLQLEKKPKNMNKEKDNKNINNNIEEQKEKKTNKPKIGKLRDNIKYKEDFVIICGDLFNKIVQYFEIDYIIELPKIIKYLPNENNNNNNNKEEKTDNKSYKLEINLEFNLEFNYLYKYENNTILYIIDFYPIKTLQIKFSEIIDNIEKERKMVKENQNQNEKKTKNNEDIYLQEYEKLNNLFFGQMIEKSQYNEKLKILNEKFKDVNDKYENQNNIETTKLRKSDLKEILVKKYNSLIINNLSKIKKDTRFRTVTEIKDLIVKEGNGSISYNDFNILFSTFNNSLYEPKIENNYINNSVNNFVNDFVLIIIDERNKAGQTYLSILDKNENEIFYLDNIFDYKINEIFDSIDLKHLKELEKADKKRKHEIELEKKLEKKLEKHEQKKLEKIEKKKIEEKEKENLEKKEKEKLIVPPFGIMNFGNTCYFNSVNQIFFNLPILQELFMNEKIFYFINKKNKFGYHGNFIMTFMSLYKLYPSKIIEKARNLRVLVGKLREIFNSDMQQDANEYLNFVLESLHEELNLKSTKRYIVDRDDNYKYNDEIELGNIAWANNLRRNVSFIDSIFMFQLKSNLICRRCNTKKVNFESNYVLDLPLSLCRIVKVEINLFKLPFKYKIYYDKINKDFYEYLKQNENKNIIDNLWDYYSEKLSYEQKLQHVTKVNFEFDFERDKTIKDITTLLRNISILEIEPENYDITIDNEDITEYKINHFTELIVYNTKSNNIIKEDTIIDKFVNKNEKVSFNVYEILNQKGFSLVQKINKNEKLEEKFNLFSYKIKKRGINKIDEFEYINYFTNINNQINNILSLKDKLSYYYDKIIDNKCIYEHESNDHKLIVIEYPIPIVHYHRELRQGNANIFLDFYHDILDYFPQQFIVFNNSKYNKITPKYLYNYIWNSNSLYLHHPNKKTDEFWWNLNPKSQNNTKKCYPFVLRIVKRKKKSKHLYDCVKCQWYNFCIGCILYPDDDDYIKIDSDSIIFVDWCNSFLKEEIERCNFEWKKISTEEITKSIFSNQNNNNIIYQSINDCFNLFFEKELLEDPLYCRVCGGPENFIKNYEINKFPYVLILALKRFKFNENYNFKLKQLITYPLYNFEINNKKYDLYGIIYHYGELNTGHYVCVIKKDNKWMMCDDRRVYEIEEEKVMNSNAYILFYISQDSINTNSYYKSLKSIMQHIVINKKKKTDFSFKDNNNFFNGEPVKTPYGEGYVIDDYIEDFIEDENKKNINNDENNENIPIDGNLDENLENEKNINNDNNKNGMINIKFDFGIGKIHKNNIKKQIIED